GLVTRRPCSRIVTIRGRPSSEPPCRHARPRGARTARGLRTARRQALAALDRGPRMPRWNTRTMASTIRAAMATLLDSHREADGYAPDEYHPEPLQHPMAEGKYLLACSEAHASGLMRD